MTLRPLVFLKLSLSLGYGHQGHQGKATEGTTIYWLGLLEYETKYCPRVAAQV